MFLPDAGSSPSADPAEWVRFIWPKMPPECFDGENLNDPGRDVYALGKVFYIAVSGESPARFPILPLEMPLSVRRKFWPILTRVCDTNPKHRFASVGEFCQALPQELPPAGRLERLLENGRQWILAHPFFLPAVSCVLILLVIAGLAAGGCYFRIQQRRAEQLRQWHLQCKAAEKRFYSRLPQFSDQLYGAADEKTARSILAELKKPPSDPKERLARYHQLDSRLKELARQQLPVIPTRASGPDILRLSERVRGLLASPLADWLDPKEKAQALAGIQNLERKVFSVDISLKPGSEFLPDSSYRDKYIYIPAGVFRNKNGKLVRISHAFWCSDVELRTDRFLLAMRRHDPGGNAAMPITNLLRRNHKNENSAPYFQHLYLVRCPRSGHPAGCRDDLFRRRIFFISGVVQGIRARCCRRNMDFELEKHHFASDRPKQTNEVQECQGMEREPWFPRTP